MIGDPPPPRWARPRSLLLPAIGFVALMVAPPGFSLVVIGVALAARGAVAGVRHVRGRQAELAERAAAGPAVMVGRDGAGQPVRIPERTLAAHGLILGATGAGKSTTLLTLLGEQIRRGRPVVAIDLKGSPAFAAELRAAADAAARPFLQWTPDGDTHWNPLAAGNATELKDKLLSTERFTEPHYRRAAERYLQLAVQLARETAPDLPLTLSRVVELLSPPRLAATARLASPARAEHIREYVASLTPDQHSAIRGLASRLAVLTESHTGPLLEPGPPERTLDVRRALRAGEVVLFSLNSSSYGGLGAMLGTLAVQDLVAASGARLADGSAQGLGALVAIDEFSALQSDNVLALLARGREAGIGVLLATQELADLDRAGRGLRDQVLGNTALKIVHRQDVPESAERVARLAGMLRVWEQSHHARSASGGPLAAGLLPAGSGAGASTSARLVERFRVEPESVSTLGTGEALVVIKSPRVSARITRIERRPPARGLSR